MGAQSSIACAHRPKEGLRRVPEQVHRLTIDLGGRIHALRAKHSFRNSIEPHWHEEVSVALIDSGFVRLIHDGKAEHVAAGEVAIINAGEVHSVDGSDADSISFRVLHIPLSTFRRAVSQEIKLPGSLHFSQTVLGDPSVFGDLSTAFHTLESEASLLTKQGMMLNIMETMIRRFSSWSGLIDQSAASSTLDRAREFLHGRISKDVSLDDLGTETGLTKFHLLRAFRNRFGLPPHAYQLQLRVLQAKRLLKSFSPSYVALECGFSDQSHFTRVFRAHTGTTPRRYAEQFRPIRATGVAFLSPVQVQ
jgi:AraC-like DNA-binding protein